MDRRREKWEEEQGRHISGEEALMASTKKNLLQHEGEGKFILGTGTHCKIKTVLQHQWEGELILWNETT